MKIFITNVQFPGHWAGTHICKEASVQPIHGDGCHELFCQEDHQALLREETGLIPVLASPAEEEEVVKLTSLIECVCTNLSL